MNNRIELRSKSDYERALEIEREVIEETGWRPPQHEMSAKFVTYPVAELADEVRARLGKEGITYQ